MKQPPLPTIPNNVLLIRAKQPPHAWSMLVLIGNTQVEGDIRPSTRRVLEAQYEVEVVPAMQAETFEVLKLSPKKDTLCHTNIIT